MLPKKASKGNWTILFLFLFLVAAPLLPGCNGGGYDVPAGVGGTHISSLLSPQQLKSWIDNGYRDDRGNKVVIFDGSSADNYNAGHIPGSYNVSYASDFNKTRSDGPMMVALMVADGPMMDGLIQKYGIDGNTTVVVFTGDTMIYTARGYWTFRYWGFPQNRLFVLNGKSTTANSVWTAAGYALTAPDTAPPPLPAPSTFSVSSWPGNIDQVRAPLDEMMNVAKGNVANAGIIDSRSEAEWNATPSFSLAMGYRFNNSVWRPYQLEFAGTNVGDPYATIDLANAGSQELKSKDELLAEWADAGLTQWADAKHTQANTFYST